MFVARILYPVEVLGYGKRIGIWFCGCHHECDKCSNPELWKFDTKYKIDINKLICLIEEICKNNIVDGFTITGGEPFLQSAELEQLIRFLVTKSQDILVYTGFTMNELLAQKNSSIEYIINNIAVLIDGKYIDSQNTEARLRGSENQVIHMLSTKYANRYTEYINNSENQIQNFTTVNGIISVGIHKPNFMEDLEKSVSSKGLEESK